MKKLIPAAAALWLLSTLNSQLSIAHAQGTAFTYQGRLNDGTSAANGSYDLRFAIYDALTAGAQQGNLLTNSATAVSNGLFTVTLDFGGQFPGAGRWLEIAVRTNGASVFTNLAPRQQITSTPYAIEAINAVSVSGTVPAGQVVGTLADVHLTPNIPRLNSTNVFNGTNIFAGVTMATNRNNLISGSFTGTLNGTATGFTGLLAGDVTGTQGATVVARVGGLTAASVASGANAASDATSANIASTIVKRDASGNFSAGTVTAAGFSGDGTGLTNIDGTMPWQVISGTAQQAQSNTGYVSTNSTLTTITLPAAPNIGDLVRATGVGTNGWKIAQNPNQLIYCANLPGNSIASWTPQDTNRNWYAIAMSSDASTLVALDYGGHIHVSTNSGLAWVAHANSRNWISVVCSGSGANMVAADFQGQMYTSTNSGSAWTARDTNRWWTALGSPYGSRLYVGESSPGPIYVSFDSGVSWSSFASAYGNWTGIACSSDLNHIYAANSIGAMQVSHDGGPTWGNMDATVPSSGWSSIACSSDGTKVVACRDGGYLYTSTNKGTNLTARASSRNWKALACSSDGSVVVAADGAPGYLYLSTDSGLTWTAQTNAPSATWSAVACKADGSKIVAAVKGGQIYISSNTTSIGTTGYLTGSQFSSVELQYVGSGVFLPISYVGTFQSY